MNNFDLFNKKQIKKRGLHNYVVMFVVLTFCLCSITFTGWFLYLTFTKKHLYHSHKKSLELMQQLENAQKRYQQDLSNKKIIQQQRSIEQSYKNCFFLLILKDIAHELPSDVRISKLEFVDKQMIELRGEALSAKSLTNFVNNLKLKPCLKKCVLEGMTKKQANNHTFFDYVIKITIAETYGQDKKVGAR